MSDGASCPRTEGRDVLNGKECNRRSAAATSQTNGDPRWRDPAARRYRAESLVSPDPAQDFICGATTLHAPHPARGHRGSLALVDGGCNRNHRPPAVFKNKSFHFLAGGECPPPRATGEGESPDTCSSSSWVMPLIRIFLTSRPLFARKSHSTSTGNTELNNPRTQRSPHHSTPCRAFCRQVFDWVIRAAATLLISQTTR